MAGTRKKAVIRTLDGSITWGYVPTSHFRQDGAVELLDPAGKAVLVHMETIRTIAFVRDFNLDDSVDPERIGRRSFQGRPRMDGLWIKLELMDRETLEGLAQFDINFLDGLLRDGGIMITPPDPRSNTQRLFIPRGALVSIQVLGFITVLSRPKTAKPPVPTGQGGLFEL